MINVQRELPAHFLDDPGSVKTRSGFLLHPLVWGIVLLLVSGFPDFVGDASSPRTEILAGLFGVGAGLTLDEFALWIHLRDVYWAEEGRSSFVVVTIYKGKPLRGAIAGAPELSGDYG